ncbi:hypothetical protein ACH5RR_025714 [Cinchona calisaya]|uniref:UspA domain-containing protein n=1 Tax=Cinchona calisaya TaxID=153742 RepID=A0ABD2Z0E9_9GENT
MARVHAKLTAFCMSRASVRVRVRSPSQHYKKTESFSKSDDKSEFCSKNSSEMSFSGDLSKLESDSTGNRVMVVVDSSLEAKAALQWALSHTVQNQDIIVLLHIAKPSKLGVNSNRESNQKAYELLHSMKNECQMRRPGVQVEMELREGNKKGQIIVDEAKERKISLLVLGQRKRSIMWHLQKMWTERRTRNRVVDYCIKNANCMTIAVRRKSRKHGGYLITTKRHKNFWLLA